MNLIKRIKHYLGWCPKHRTEKGDLFKPRAVWIEKSGGHKGRSKVVYKPRFNFRTLYSILLVAFLLLVSMVYYISIGIMTVAYLLGLTVVLFLFTVLYDYMSMPVITERGVAFGFQKGEIYEWEEIRDIEVKKELIFLLRWVINLPKLIIHVERGDELMKVKKPAYTISDLEELHRVMVGEWRKRR